MTQPFGEYRMELVTGTRPYRCDICTGQCDDGGVQSFYGNIPQSAVCGECVSKIANLVNERERILEAEVNASDELVAVVPVKRKRRVYEPEVEV